MVVNHDAAAVGVAVDSGAVATGAIYGKTEVRGTGFEGGFEGRVRGGSRDRGFEGFEGQGFEGGSRRFEEVRGTGTLTLATHTVVSHRVESWIQQEHKKAERPEALVFRPAAGRGASEPAALRRHAAQDLGTAAAERVALPGRESTAFELQKGFAGSSVGRSAIRPLNHCLRADGRALGPAAGDDAQGSARRDVVLGAARVYTGAVPGPKGKSWLGAVSTHDALT